MLCFLVSFAIKLLDITHNVYHKRRTAGRLSRYSPLSHRARQLVPVHEGEIFYKVISSSESAQIRRAARWTRAAFLSARSFPSTHDVAH